MAHRCAPAALVALWITWGTFAKCIEIEEELLRPFANPIDVKESAARYEALASQSAARLYGHGLVLGAVAGLATARVYAPHAKTVSVAGSWNEWDPLADSLHSEGDGWWFGALKGPAHGDPYMFVVWNGTDMLWRPDPWSKHQKGDVALGHSLAYDNEAFQWTDNDWVMPDASELVIYELHVGTFGRSEVFPPATFDQCLQNLDHLVKLGVNAVQVMPVAEFDGKTSWGYDGAYVYAVESSYGGPDGFKRFVNACHQRGLAVILDVVYNHLGPFDLGIWRFDGWYEDPYGGIYFYNDARSKTPWGPRPDFSQDHVRAYIRDSAMQWLDTFHCDGLRVDGVGWIRSITDGDSERNPDGWKMLQLITDSAHTLGTKKLLIAEDFMLRTDITASTSTGGAGFDVQNDPDFHHPLRNGLAAKFDEQRSAAKIGAAVSHFIGSPEKRLVYTENHDEVANGRTRVPDEVFPGCPSCWQSRKMSTLGAALVMTSPGVPVIFQGQEFLETGWFAATRALDWSKQDVYEKIVNLYRDLIALRRNVGGMTQALTSPHCDVFHADDEKGIVAFRRHVVAEGDGAHSIHEDVVVIANLKNKAWGGNYIVGFPRAGQWKMIFDSDSPEYKYSNDFDGAQAVDVVTNAIPRDGFSQSASITIAPYTCVIYVRSGQEQHLRGDRKAANWLPTIISTAIIVAFVVLVIPLLVLRHRRSAPIVQQASLIDLAVLEPSVIEASSVK